MEEGTEENENMNAPMVFRALIIKSQIKGNIQSHIEMMSSYL